MSLIADVPCPYPIHGVKTWARDSHTRGLWESCLQWWALPFARWLWIEPLAQTSPLPKAVADERERRGMPRTGMML